MEQMLDNLGLRNKFVLATIVPCVALIAISVVSATSTEVPSFSIGVGAGVAAVVGLVAAIRIGGNSAARLETISGALTETDLVTSSIEVDALDAVTGTDEIGRTAGAARDVVGVARSANCAERATIAHRFGSLLHTAATEARQLSIAQTAALDWLEATEEDADSLERLFTIDRAAARARRLADRLLVLVRDAGALAPAGDSSAATVVRVGLAATEHFETVELRALDDAMIDGTTAPRLALLLAELFDNATKLSDSEPVEAYARLLDDGSYRLTMIDKGPGLDEATLRRVNELVVSPPPIDQLSDVAIGLVVVGRLAVATGASVVFTSIGKGTTCEVIVPADRVSAIPQAARIDSRIERASRNDDRWVAPLAPPKRRARLSDLAMAADPSAPPESAAPAPANDANRSDEPPIPAPSDEWTAATAAPLSAGGGRALVKRRRRKLSQARSANGPAASSRNTTRSPEEVRSLVTRYRDGLAGGRAGHDPAADEASG